MKVIVDTCGWAQFLRRNRAGGNAATEVVTRLVRADAIQMLGPIRQELLSGARPTDRFDQLRNYLRFYPNLPLDEEDDERAADYYNHLRQRGVAGTATDLIICAAAVRYGMKIYTIDSDFERYAQHIPIKLQQARAAL